MGGLEVFKCISERADVYIGEHGATLREKRGSSFPYLSFSPSLGICFPRVWRLSHLLSRVL